MAERRVLLAWSGGKDSALALDALRARGRMEVAALLCTVTADDGRVSGHGVRRALVARQAEALDCPLHQVSIPARADNVAYEAAFAGALAEHAARGLDTIAFGDLSLTDVRTWREATLAHLGWNAHFPLWGADTTDLARRFIELGFRATVVCADAGVLDASFAGRPFDAAFLADLPPGVDPCGENGEFHTFVWDGPGFRAPLALRTGAVDERDGFVYCDLIEA